MVVLSGLPVGVTTTSPNTFDGLKLVILVDRPVSPSYITDKMRGLCS